MVKQNHMHQSDTIDFLVETMEGYLVKYKRGMADCAYATDLPASTGHAVLRVHFGAHEFIFGPDKRRRSSSSN